jgi:hypothetical protein
MKGNPYLLQYTKVNIGHIKAVNVKSHIKENIREYPVTLG